MAVKPKKGAGKGGSVETGGDGRMALIHAAIICFGEQGFDATSTRTIAAKAGVNLALISYHFGGKQGLYDACAETIAMRLKQVAGTSLVAAAEIEGLTPDAALAALEVAARSLIGFMVADAESRHLVMFVVRELTHQGKLVEIVYSNVFEPVHRSACHLFALAAGHDGENDDIKLSVFAMIGQIIYFRLAMPIITRRMGWQKLGPDEVEDISRQIIFNLRSTVNAKRAETGLKPAGENGQ